VHGVERSGYSLSLTSVGVGPIGFAVMASDFDRVTDPAYLDGLSAKPMDAVRAMRDECQVLENAASYVRRFVQGRLDVVAQARVGSAPASPAEISTAISADEQSGGTAPAGFGRPVQDISPDLIPRNLLDQLDQIIGADELVMLDTVAPDRLNQAFDELSSFEQQVSSDRRSLHEIIDQIQADIVRRYRDGEASVDRLLD